MDYQVLFADEMAQAFAEAAADHRARGPAVFARFVVGESLGGHGEPGLRVVREMDVGQVQSRPLHAGSADDAAAWCQQARALRLLRKSV